MYDKFTDQAPYTHEPRNFRKIFWQGLMFIATAVVVIVAVFIFVLFRSNPEPKDFHFQVAQNDTVHTIAKRLQDEGIVKHRFLFYFSYYVFGNHTAIQPAGYKLSNTMPSRDIVYALEAKPASKFVNIPKGLSKEEIAEILADALGWPALDRQFFSHTYAGMQWQHYQEHIRVYFQEKYAWNERKTHTFLTLSALYYDGSYDFLKEFYISGKYEIPIGASRAQVAGILLDRFIEENADDKIALQRYINTASADTVARLIDEQMVLTPDIVAIPPQDLTIKEIDGEKYLLFTVSYWNKGRGPLDLIADPETKGITDDHERKVYQRIYSLDGDYTERLSGKFLWHSPHLHYHFQDFAAYSLKPVVGGPLAPSKQSQKSTYCIRDSEPIDLAHPGAQKSPLYATCGKERQGISPGWADSYYYTYVDQRFNVTNLPVGEYVLRVDINPLDRFDEITTDNNAGEVLINLDVKNDTVKIISEKTHGLND